MDTKVFNEGLSLIKKIDGLRALRNSFSLGLIHVPNGDTYIPLRVCLEKYMDREEAAELKMLWENCLMKRYQNLSINLRNYKKEITVTCLT